MKNNSFRYVSLLLVACILLGSATMVSASTIQPRYTYFSSIQADLAYNSSTGEAECVAVVSGSSTVTVKVECYLKMLSVGSWKTLEHWTATNYITTGIDANCAVTSGYTYRLYVYAYALDANNNVLEKAELTRTLCC